MTPPTWFDWLTVAAIVTGPVLALFTQRCLDYLRQKKRQRTQLYLRLMGTRASHLSPEHVNALNSIDVVFSRKRDQRVRHAWERFLAHVARSTSEQGWFTAYNDLKIDLLQEMGSAVGYTFSTDYLRRQIYAPQGYSQVEQELTQLRQRLVGILRDDGLMVKVAGEPITRQEPVASPPA